jgi:hypothetical protein
MNLLERLLEIEDGGIVREIARVFGLRNEVALEAVSRLVPALSRGLDRNTSDPRGLEELAKALAEGGHSRYVEHPEILGDEDSIEDGNAILGHILGSRDVSRNVAGYASEETVASSDTLKKILPMVASASMGTLGASLFGADDTEIPDLLRSLVSSEGEDASDLDDVISLAKRFF